MLRKGAQAVSVVVIGMIIMLIVVLLPVQAQVGVEGTILGTVVDSAGAAIPGAIVTVVAGGTQLTRTATAKANGEFEIPALPIGSYTVTVTAPGMRTWRLDSVNLTIGARFEIAPCLQVGSLQQTVTVSARDQVLQTQQSSVNTSIEAETLAALPAADRNPISFVELVPGMRFEGEGGPENGAYVHGMGLRNNAVNFTIDGINTNAPMDDGAIDLPILEDVDEINVQTSNASAEHGRDPIQVTLVTKTGTNSFHGRVWEYFQNDDLNATDAFSFGSPKARQRYNQFGGNLGGPILRNKIFFFGSVQDTLNPGTTQFTEFAPTAARLNGDFSTLDTAITDPTTGNSFPNNVIPADKINPASKAFIPYLPTANVIGGPFGSLYVAQAPTSYDAYQGTTRLDYNIDSKQKIYVRGVHWHSRYNAATYLPAVTYNNTLDQYNFGANYTNTLTPNMLLTVTAGYVRTDNWFNSPEVGKTNYTAEAGIQGVPTTGREDSIGLPNLTIDGGYPGISLPFGVNGKLWGGGQDLNAELRINEASHTLAIGYELQNKQVYGRHGSSAPRGAWEFTGQYTGDGLADYLLGYASNSQKNLPLNTFGLSRVLNSALHIQDDWKIAKGFTANLGLRYEFYNAPQFVAGNVSTFDLGKGLAIAGEDSTGKVNLSQQPIAKDLGPATATLWEPASQAGLHPNIYSSEGHFQPRIGFAWQPHGPDVVFRAGYAIYANVLTGNDRASSVASIPFFDQQTMTLSPSQLVDWRTMWPSSPSNFSQAAMNSGNPVPGIRAARTQQWNASMQLATPLQSSLTIGYVGTKAQGQPYTHSYNEVPPGYYPDLQSALPYPNFGSIQLIENGIDTWYHGLQEQWERRYHGGLYVMESYMWSKGMSNRPFVNGQEAIAVPFAPEWYERGPVAINDKHNLKISAVYQLPIGDHRMLFSGMNRWLDGAFGGWETSGYFALISGPPLTFAMPDATLGNGWSTRADLVGNPNLPNRSRLEWFNVSAFSAPPLYQWGTSGIGAVTGPTFTQSNLSLSKDFYWREGEYLQFRAEAYNAFNNVRLGAPDTTLGDSNFGMILSDAGPRTMQLSARIVF